MVGQFVVLHRMKYCYELNFVFYEAVQSLSRNGGAIRDYALRTLLNHAEIAAEWNYSIFEWCSYW